MEDDEASNSAILGDRGLSINNNPTSSSLTNDIKPLLNLVDMSVILPLYNELSPIAFSCNTLVFTAVAQQTKRRVAVKRISLRKCTTISTIKNMLREVKILRRLDHDNVVRISNVVLSTSQNASSGSTSPNSLVHPKSSTDTIPASNALEFPYDALYLEMELVDIDLHSILNQRKLSPSYVKLFSYQLLRGLKYIHSANVIHRDLTPANVFINIDTLMLKIGDFGVSRIYDPNYEHTRHLSITASSTWYQSPEMMITPGHYNRAVDVWAAGCIIAEMCIGSALFPGENALEQMDLICGMVENTEEEWGSVVNLKCSEPDCMTGEVVAPLIDDDQAATDLAAKLRSHEIEPDVLDLIVCMLQFDPHKRATITDALVHPAFDELRCMYDEPQCNHPFHIEDELDDFSLGKCQELLKLRANELVSVDSSGVDASNDELLRASAKSSIHGGNSVSHTTNKNLLELVHSGSSANPGNHHDCAMSESEARKMACDFDYGVQIADGSINRDRMLMDWRPQSPETACFDPYKWNNDTTTQLIKEEDGENVDGEEATVVSPVSHEDDVGGVKVINKQVTDGVQDAASHSDHGYHSSYCSSNLSNGKPIHSHSLWSLSSPDVSIDHEHRAAPANSASVTTAIHRAVTPDVEAAAGLTANLSSASSGNINASGVALPEQDQDQQQQQNSSSDHVPSRFQSPTASMDNMEGKRRHKDEVIPHHHQSFHMSYHHHHHYHHGHHHHHHHHHHKHHRHSSRHGTSSSQSNLIQRNGNQQSEVVHQRRCLVEDVVQELSEETTSDSTITGTTTTDEQPQPSGECKREKRHHHHHHRSSKSSSSIKMTSSQETLKDGSEVDAQAADNEKDFFQREPGYHERLSAEKSGDDEAEALNNNNNEQVESDDVDHPAIKLAFPWMASNTSAAENAATTADTTTTLTSVVEISTQQQVVGEAAAADDNLISSMQERLKALQISATAPIPPPPPTPSSCATQSKRVGSLELPRGYHHIAGSDEQKKTKRRVECPY